MNRSKDKNGAERGGPVAVWPVTAVEELGQLEAVQRALSSGDESLILHVPWMLALVRNGGLVLGAFDGARAVGFLVGFLGTDQPAGARPAMADLKHVSGQIGVLPAYQNRGVGLKLKLAQRDFVIRQGVRLVTWTFDPLDSRNAYFNMRKLGAVTRRLLRDDGQAPGDARQDDPTSDRLLAEWWVGSRRVERRLSGERAGLALDDYTSAEVPILNPTTSGHDDLPLPAETITDAGQIDNLIALIEIPGDFASIQTHRPDLALRWRVHARDVFEQAFAAGYISTDFVTARVDGRPRSFYVLSQGDAAL